MAMRLIIAVPLIALSACSEPPPPPAPYNYEDAYRQAVQSVAEERGVPVSVIEAEAEEEALRQSQIEEVRRADPALNWVNIGVTTGKFSESLGSSVHRTYDECAQSSHMEDNECFPIPALPDSYWNAE